MHGQHNIILRCTVSTTLYWDARSAQHQNLQFATQMFCRRPPLTTSDSIIEGVGEYNNHYSYFQIPWQRYRILSSVIRRACSPKGRATNFSVQALPSPPPPLPGPRGLWRPYLHHCIWTRPPLEIQVFCDVAPCSLANTDVSKDSSASIFRAKHTLLL